MQYIPRIECEDSFLDLLTKAGPLPPAPRAKLAYPGPELSRPVTAETAVSGPKTAATGTHNADLGETQEC